MIIKHLLQNGFSGSKTLLQVNLGVVVLLLITSQAFAQGPKPKNIIDIEKGGKVFLKINFGKSDVSVINAWPYDEYSTKKTSYGAAFKDSAIFDQATFYDGKNGLPLARIYLSRFCFYKMTSFYSTRFMGLADFNLTAFKDTVDFTQAGFIHPAIFTNGIFRKLSNFTRVNFSKIMYFNFLKLKDSARLSFYQAKLPDIMDLSNNVVIPQKIDFSSCNFDRTDLYESKRRWHYMNLYASDLSRIKIDYVHFRLCFYKSFYLVDSNFRFTPHKGEPLVSINNGHPIKKSDLFNDCYFKSYIKRIFPQTDLCAGDSFWGTTLSFLHSYDNPVIKEFVDECFRRQRFPKALSDEEIFSIYEKELKNFDTEGQRTSYKYLDIEYKTYKNEFGVIPHFWNCYGYHKEWVFYWLIFFLLGFSLISRWKLKRLILAYTIPNLFEDTREKSTDPRLLTTEDVYMKLNWWQKLLYALILTFSIFFPFSFDFEKLKLNTWWVTYLFIVYLTGIFCVGYLAAFILQKGI